MKKQTQKMIWPKVAQRARKEIGGKRKEMRPEGRLNRNEKRSRGNDRDMDCNALNI